MDAKQVDENDLQVADPSLHVGEVDPRSILPTGSNENVQVLGTSGSAQSGPVVQGSLEHIKSITTILKKRLAGAAQSPLDYSSKRTRETISNPNNEKSISPIVHIIKKIRSVIVGLSQQSVSRPRNQYPDLL